MHALCSRYIAASLFVERFCCEFLSFVSPIVASFSVSFYASYAFFSISFSIYCPSLYGFLFGRFGGSFCIRCPTSYAILFIALPFYLVLFSCALFLSFVLSFISLLYICFASSPVYLYMGLRLMCYFPLVFVHRVLLSLNAFPSRLVLSIEIYFVSFCIG